MFRLIRLVPAGIVMVGLFFLTALDANAQRRSRPTASTMDSQGNTYTTGWRVTNQDGSNYVADLVTVKYDKSGNRLWTDSFPKNSGFGPDEIRDAEGWGIAVDRHGNVYVAGHIAVPNSVQPGHVDCLLLKYAANHEQGSGPEWVRTIAGDASLNDQFWHLTLDPDGFIFVTGQIAQFNDGLASIDIITVKYDPNGHEVWRSILNGPANLSDVAVAVAVDPVRRNVFVTGLSNRRTAAGNRTSMITIMCDAAGIQQWVRRYDGPADGHNSGTSLALDPEGSVYVAGWSQGLGSLDFATVKFDLNGDEQWAARYDGPAGSNDQPAPPILWSIGGSFNNYLQTNQGIIVTPEVIDPVPALAYLMERVKAAGLPRGLENSLLVKIENCLKSLVAANAAVRQNAANLLVAFLNEAGALEMDGWLSVPTALELKDAAAHIRKGILGIPTTVVYVAGQSTGVGTGMDMAIVKFNGETGRPMWNLPGQPGTTSAQPGTPMNIALRYSSPGNAIDRGWAVAINADGELFLTGPSFVSSNSAVDFFTAKVRANSYQPEIVAEARLDVGYAGPGQPCSIATWMDPDTGRMMLLRDPVSGDDYVAVSGNRAFEPNPTFRSLTVMYDGHLVEKWWRSFYD
jgi:hypothetical protein